MTSSLPLAFDAHENVVFVEDQASGLAAIIAIHSTHLGPAAGGCRFAHYPATEDALTDALRLSQGMSYKNALAGLPAGGGKAVIYQAGPDRAAVFKAFGREVEALGGRYITAEDVGTSVADMTLVAGQTRHVAGLAPTDGRAGGDPSPWTALGTFLSLQAALDRPLSGARIAVQGIGSVGLHLCQLLHDHGAKLVVADVNAERTRQAQLAFGAEVETVERIHRAAADAFAPCALGGELNAETIADLGAALVCGAANNQLAIAADGARLLARGITYCPDYVVNAGGIISVIAEHLGDPADVVEGRVRAIPTRLSAILSRAKAEKRAVNLVADELAREKIGRAAAERQVA